MNIIAWVSLTIRDLSHMPQGDSVIEAAPLAPSFSRLCRDVLFLLCGLSTGYSEES